MIEGEIVRYDFEVYADDTLIDTTSEELAKEQEIHDENAEYQPRYAIIGMEGPFPGLKDALLQAETDGESEVEVEPKDAFGERNPRYLDYRRYADIARIANQQEKDVERGQTLEIDGRIATITLITPARVRIDYNHAHAGKKIRSKVFVRGVLSETDEIINAILQMNIGNENEFEFSEEDGILSMKVPSSVSLGLDWTTMKLRVVTQLRKHTGIKNIRYIEEFFQKTETIEDVPEGEGEGEDASDDTSEAAPEEPPTTDDEASNGEEDPAPEEEISVTVGSDVAVAEPKEE